MNETYQFTHQCALTYTRVTHQTYETIAAVNQCEQLMEVAGTRDEVLDPTRNEFAEVGFWGQVAEGAFLCDVEPEGTGRGVMGSQHQELSTLMRGELAGERELLLSKVKSRTDTHIVIDAGTVELSREFLAGLIEDLEIVPHTDDMQCSSTLKNLSGRLRVTTRNKDQL
jgi:hypothetical protein